MAKHQVVVPCETALQISCPHFSVSPLDTIIVDKLLHSSLINKLLYSYLINTLLYSYLLFDVMLGFNICNGGWVEGVYFRLHLSIIMVNYLTLG